MNAENESAMVLSLHQRIAEIPETDWDACAGTDQPFLSHAFLNLLEQSQAVSERTGWAPQHACLRDASGQILGVAPMYVKMHSLGEYVFDHGWAQAFERAGGQYYPKLLVAVPFTPVPGRRLLIRNGDMQIQEALVRGILDIAEANTLSSVHFTFCTEAEWQSLGAMGLLQRTGEQFHWENDNYGTFDDFLSALASRKRKQIRREREAVREAGITIETISGVAFEERHWDAMFQFYMDTGSRKWGSPYLNRQSFTLMHEQMADKIVLMLASRNGRPIAGALNFIGQDTLYGRYWGCVEEHPCLHFELCYYRAIDYAIENRLARVEAGAQGPHKLARGYRPKPTYSAHWIADPNFRGAVDRYLQTERAEVEAEIAYLDEHSPFRRSEN